MRRHLRSRRRWNRRLPSPRRSPSSGVSVRRRGLLLRVLAGICVIGVLLVILDARMRPLIQDFGENGAKMSAMRALNDAVERTLAKAALTYEDLVRVDKDSEGNVQSIEADVVRVNQLKASINTAVMDEMEKYETIRVEIPFGNLLGGNYFTGRGPYIPITVRLSGVVLSDLTSRFESAGVNQTSHQIGLDVTMHVYAALPGMRTGFDITTDFLVAETVLVGQVPQTYLQMSGAQVGDLQKIFGSDASS